GRERGGISQIHEIHDESIHPSWQPSKDEEKPGMREKPNPASSTQPDSTQLRPVVSCCTTPHRAETNGVLSNSETSFVFPLVFGIPEQKRGEKKKCMQITMNHDS